MLEAEFSELAESQPELIAHHYTESGQNKEALVHWGKAGTNAMGRWATGEAVSHFRAALRVLAKLPTSAERNRRELEIQTALGPALLASCGFSEPTLGETYKRASELCEFEGDHRQTCLALRGQQIYHFSIGELENARRIAGQLLQRAGENEEIGYQVGGSHAKGQCLFLLGEFRAAQTVLEKGIEIAGTEPLTVADWPGGQPAEQCHLYAAFVSWALGYPDRALEQAERGLALSEALENPISLLNSEAFVTAIYWLRRDAPNVGLHAERTISLCQQHGHPTFHGYARTLHGASRAMQNRLDDGIEEMEGGIEEWCALHMRLWIPMMNIPLVEAYASRGAFKKGLNMLSQWKTRVASTSERAWDSEFHRLQAGLISHEPEQTKRAIACLKEALRIARAQQAKSFELRAATALAKLWSRNDRSEEGFELLEPIYNWFTEGFDTADLVDARNLLEKLS
jgi:predicted ATPase